MTDNRSSIGSNDVPDAMSKESCRFAEAVFTGMRAMDGKVDLSVSELRHTLEIKARSITNQARFAEDYGHQVASGVPIKQFRFKGTYAWIDEEEVTLAWAEGFTNQIIEVRTVIVSQDAPAAG